MRLATHNVKITLDDTDAAACLNAVLAYEPDVIGLVEWGRARRKILAATGTVVAAPRLRALFRKHPADGLVWVYPIGGQPVGVRADKYEVLTVRRLVIAPEANGVRQTDATEVVLRDRRTGKRKAILNTHPVAHHNRRANLRSWRRSMQSIDDWADSWTGYDRYVMGDLNKETVRIEGLTSCRVGNGELPTFDSRDRDGDPDRGIDHIFGPRKFADATTVKTESDHRALVADERDQIKEK